MSLTQFSPHFTLVSCVLHSLVFFHWTYRLNVPIISLPPVCRCFNTNCVEVRYSPVVDDSDGWKHNSRTKTAQRTQEVWFDLLPEGGGVCRETMMRAWGWSRVPFNWPCFLCWLHGWWGSDNEATSPPTITQKWIPSDLKGGGGIAVTSHTVIALYLFLILELRLQQQQEVSARESLRVKQWRRIWIIWAWGQR